MLVREQVRTVLSGLLLMLALGASVFLVRDTLDVLVHPLLPVTDTV